jgi:HTH-type transcriptional regulator, competence development regulator
VDDPDNTLLVQVGSEIRKGRLAAGLNLHELARLCGISAPALSLIENGKRDLRVSSLFRIASALRLEVANLLEEQRVQSKTQQEPSSEGYDLGDYQ